MRSRNKNEKLSLSEHDPHFGLIIVGENSKQNTKHVLKIVLHKSSISNLKYQLHAQLDGAVCSGSEHWIRSRGIGGDTAAAEAETG
jgi:hypothetical protein